MTKDEPKAGSVPSAEHSILLERNLRFLNGNEPSRESIVLLRNTILGASPFLLRLVSLTIATLGCIIIILQWGCWRGTKRRVPPSHPLSHTQVPVHRRLPRAWVLTTHEARDTRHTLEYKKHVREVDDTRNHVMYHIKVGNVQEPTPNIHDSIANSRKRESLPANVLTALASSSACVAGSTGSKQHVLDTSAHVFHYVITNPTECCFGLSPVTSTRRGRQRRRRTESATSFVVIGFFLLL